MLNPKKDERRPLDEEGILQSRYVGRLLANLDVQVDQIVSSPLIDGTDGPDAGAVVHSDLGIAGVHESSDAVH